MEEYICSFCDKKNKSKMSQSIHQIRCKLNPNYKDGRFKTPSRKGKYKSFEKSKITETRMNNKERREQCLKNNNFKCIYCSKDFFIENNKKWFQMLKLHESFCEKNLKSHKRKILSEDSRKKISESLKNKKIVWDPEKRLKHSETMKKVASEKPASYIGSNRGRVKEIEVDGIKVQGTWELIFYLWAKENKLNPQKVAHGFPYIWKGERLYFPDFYLPVKNIYVEIKGYETERDLAKWDAFPNKLIILKKEEIYKIKSNKIKNIEEFFLYQKTLQY